MYIYTHTYMCEMYANKISLQKYISHDTFLFCTEFKVRNEEQWEHIKVQKQVHLMDRTRRPPGQERNAKVSCYIWSSIYRLRIFRLDVRVPRILYNNIGSSQ